MRRAKYRIVRHEISKPGLKSKVYYTVQRRGLLFWHTITTTIDCSDRVPNCDGYYTEPVEFHNEMDAQSFIERRVVEGGEAVHLRKVFAVYDRNGVWMGYVQ